MRVEFSSAEPGLPNLTQHGLRHTAATWLADAGIPLHVLQGILGHKSSETTRGYLHPGTWEAPQRKPTPSSAAKVPRVFNVRCGTPVRTRSAEEVDGTMPFGIGSS